MYIISFRSNKIKNLSENFSFKSVHQMSLVRYFNLW